jgi:hypothetical protein
MADRIDAFARRLRNDPTFLAAAMEDYARSEGLDGAGLATRLRIPAATLGPLGLCRRPTGERFAHDLHTIADRFGVDETLLAEVVRRSDALRTLRSGQTAAQGGMVAAARDRDLHEPPEWYMPDAAMASSLPPFAADALPFAAAPHHDDEQTDDNSEDDVDEPS